MNTAEYSREDIIAGNPLLDYAERQGWKLKKMGPNFVCLCPLHEETTPSFTFNPNKNLWKCFGCGAGGSVIDLHSRLRSITVGKAMGELSPAGGSDGPSSNRKHRARQAQTEAEQRARLRANWPAFDKPVEDEVKAIAERRGLSPEGVSLAAERGLLFCAQSPEGRCWIVTDSQWLNAQARRMDGKPWERFSGSPKAWTLPGSIASWPIGVPEAAAYSAIALVEGAPDLLAALHLVWCAGVERRIAPVAILGAGNLFPKDAIPKFAGKRVRIFQHDDIQGRAAGARWARQLVGTANVDGFSFTGLTRSDGAPVKDLNDFANIDPDQWEEQRDVIEEAFAFAPAAASQASDGAEGSKAEEAA